MKCKLYSIKDNKILAYCIVKEPVLSCQWEYACVIIAQQQPLQVGSLTYNYIHYMALHTQPWNAECRKYVHFFCFVYISQAFFVSSFKLNYLLILYLSALLRFDIFLEWLNKEKSKFKQTYLKYILVWNGYRITVLFSLLTGVH